MRFFRTYDNLASYEPGNMEYRGRAYSTEVGAVLLYTKSLCLKHWGSNATFYHIFETQHEGFFLITKALVYAISSHVMEMNRNVGLCPPSDNRFLSLKERLSFRCPQKYPWKIPSEISSNWCSSQNTPHPWWGNHSGGVILRQSEEIFIRNILLVAHRNILERYPLKYPQPEYSSSPVGQSLTWSDPQAPSEINLMLG